MRTDPKALLCLVALSPFVACQCGTSGSVNPSSGTTTSASSTSGAGTGTGTGASSTSSGTTSGNVVPLSLAFSPAAQTITVTGAAPQTASFILQVTDSNGTKMSVPPDSVTFDRPDLATVTTGNPVVVTAPSSAGFYAGTGTLQASYGSLMASATVTVVVQLADYGDSGLSATNPVVVALSQPNLPADPLIADGGFLYPYDQTVWPLGLTSPLLMWNAPQVGDVYRLHYAEASYTFDGYYTLTALPAQMRLDQGTWIRITASNTQDGGPLAFSLSRWDSDAGVAYQTMQESWTIAPASLQGAIYYWTVTKDNGDENGHITRFQPGSGSQPVLLNNGTCMGCHSVNVQGTFLAGDVDSPSYPSSPPFQSNDEVSRVWSITDLSTAEDIGDAGLNPSMITTEYGGDLSITPDGKYVLFGGPMGVPGSKYLALAVAADGGVVVDSGLDQVDVPQMSGQQIDIMMPAFAPSGGSVAFVVGTGNSYIDNILPSPADQSTGQIEQIATLGFDESVPFFSPELHVVVDGFDPTFTQGTGLGYPSFTPDSQAIAFHAGTYTTGCHDNCDDFTDDDGNLFMVDADGGAPIYLSTVNDPPNPADWDCSIEPTFNPIQRGGYAWVVFTSMRNWGNQPWQSGISGPGHVNGMRRLWAAAIDPVLGTVDPSHPAFYLEGQEERPNMRGFWTLAPCLASSTLSAADAGASDGGSGCTEGFQCCSGFCINGQCADVGKVACVSLGGSCTTNTDCCGNPNVICQGGTCNSPFE